MYETTSSEEETDDDGEEAIGGKTTAGLVDIEDIGKMVHKMKKAKKQRDADRKNGELREMVTLMLRKALTKQGYRVVGSHSGIKLCRWTKSMLRGRGGCYKHTFYGIESRHCMETTPSLACANKCVFCWRHHTNPVGTEWRWKMDNPEDILKECLVENHYQMIKEFRAFRFTQLRTRQTHCFWGPLPSPVHHGVGSSTHEITPKLSILLTGKQQHFTLW